MAHYMGPTTSVSEILEKLSVIFGMVASFYMLMQNFYKITQGVTVPQGQKASERLY